MLYNLVFGKLHKPKINVIDKIHRYLIIVIFMWIPNNNRNTIYLGIFFNLKLCIIIIYYCYCLFLVFTRITTSTTLTVTQLFSPAADTMYVVTTCLPMAGSARYPRGPSNYIHLLMAENDQFSSMQTSEAVWHKRQSHIVTCYTQHKT